MNFDDEDDNNPFSGSNYYFSNGIDGGVNGTGTTAHTEGNTSLSSAPCLDSSDEPDWVAATHPDDYVSEDELHQKEQLTSFLSSDAHLTTRRRSIGGMQQGAIVDIIGAEASRDYKASLTIFYKIQINGDPTQVVRRRYSDFNSFRFTLLRLFPTKVIPPIPEKHSLGKLIKSPLHYQTDSKVISSRIRLLHNFLDTLLRDPEIGPSEALAKFLDPKEKSWNQTLKTPPFTMLPPHPLLYSPQTPTKPNPYHSYLPVPPASSLKAFDSKLNTAVFKPIELRFRDLMNCLLELERNSKKIEKDMTSYCSKLTDLGGHYNVMSLLEPHINPNPLEIFGQGVDSSFINLEILIKNFRVNFKEPIKEIRATCSAVLNLLGFRKWKDLQLNYLKTLILKKQLRTKKLLEMETLNVRLDVALSQKVLDSPTITEALRRFEGSRTSSSKLSGVEGKQSETESNWKNLFSGSKKDVNSLSSMERQREIRNNRQDLAKLTKCFELLSDDVKFLSIEVERNVLLEEQHLKRKISYILADYQKMMLIFGSENISVWKDKIRI